MEVVILCGGKGTRSYPFTEYLPKVMIPISGRPIIVHLMEIYARQGFESFILAAGHRKEILFDYFEGRFRDWKIQVIDTGEESDTGERIRRCQSYVNDSFLATYGDGLGDIRLGDLVQFHRDRGALATLTTVPLRSQYGTVNFDGSNRVHSFREKPVIQDYWINAGFFLFEKRVFDFWEGQNLECEVLPALARRGALFAYRHNGFWKSMDTFKDQQEMERTFESGRPPWQSDVPLSASAAAGNGRHG